MSLKNIIMLSVLLLSISFISCDDEDTPYYSKKAGKYLYAETDDCNSVNCPEPNWCSDDKKICYCIKGRANYPFGGERGQFCVYKQHSQLACFLWELLLNIGIGHFIIKDNLIGILKLIIMLVPCVITILSLLGLLKTGYGHGTTATISSTLRIVFGVGAFVWWLTDASKRKYFLLI